MHFLKTQWLGIVVHVGAWIPLVVMIWNLMHNDLTVDPIRGILLWTGKTALTLLILSLACTPFNTLGFRSALRVRRALGLYAFGYVVIHLFTFVVIDYGLEAQLIYGALFEKPYALVGFASFLILLPSALTSTTGWMKRLGQLWKRVHQFVYLAALLAIVHFVWLVKLDVREPLLYGAIVVALLAIRLTPIRHLIGRLRNRPSAIPLAQRPQKIERLPD